MLYIVLFSFCCAVAIFGKKIGYTTKFKYKKRNNTHHKIIFLKILFNMIYNDRVLKKKYFSYFISKLFKIVLVQCMQVSKTLKNISSYAIKTISFYIIYEKYTYVIFQFKKFPISFQISMKYIQFIFLN